MLERNPGKAAWVFENAIPPQRVDIRPAQRPVFRYSVIRGGVYNPAELVHAVQSDPVVAAHYRNLDPAHLRAMASEFAKPVYVSYRKGDEIFWTRKPVVLAPGEPLLTDGKLFARARCGNQVSEEARSPVAEEPVEESALEDVELSEPWEIAFAQVLPDLPLPEAPLPKPRAPEAPFPIAPQSTAMIPRYAFFEDYGAVIFAKANPPNEEAWTGPLVTVPVLSVETPEPGSILLFGLGGATLLVLRRRKNRSRS